MRAPGPPHVLSSSPAQLMEHWSSPIRVALLAMTTPHQHSARGPKLDSNFQDMVKGRVVIIPPNSRPAKGKPASLQASRHFSGVTSSMSMSWYSVRSTGLSLQQPMGT